MVLSYFSLIQTITALDSDEISWLHLQITGPLSFFVKKKKLLFWLLFLLVISHCRLKNHFLDYDHSGHNTTCIYYTLCLFLFVCLVFGGTSQSESCQIHLDYLLSHCHPATQVTTQILKHLVSQLTISFTLYPLFGSTLHDWLNSWINWFWGILIRLWWDRPENRKPPENYLFSILVFTFSLYCAINLWSVKYDLPFSHKETRNELISKSGEWILANVNCTGYYRVNYNPENWKRLLTQLETNKDVSTEPNNNTQ